MADPILDPLNPEQRAAVTHGDGPLLILAGAGSGKTRVLTHRVAYLIRERAVPASAILAVTFTNKAAREMRERLERLIGKEQLAELTVGTFHAFCARLLRREGPAVGIDRSFAIYDEADQRAVLRQAMSETQVSERVFAPGAIAAVISAAKNELKGPADLAANPKGQLDRVVAIAWKRYDELLRENNAVDFDDLLLLACRLFETNDRALERWQDRYQHILVDEYQDTNRAQYVLLRYLAGFRQNLAVVGDDDQSVFSWRGADVRNILDFERDYATATVVKLEQNYRSTQRILDAAWSVVRNNAARKEKRLWTDRSGGADLVVMQAYDEGHEAELVAREIERLQRDGEAHGVRDVAILYRTNAQSRAIEDTFRAFGLAYQVVGGVSFYQRREVKDALAYLRLLHNPNDAFALARVLNTPPRGLGDKTRAALLAHSRERGLPLGEALGSCAAMLPARTTPSVRAHPGVVLFRSGTMPQVTLSATSRRHRTRNLDQLRALPQPAFDALPERDRALVELYCGRTDGEPHSWEDLGKRFGLGRCRVGQILRRSMVHLLGVGSAPKTWAVLVCATCGTQFARRRWDVRRQRAYACSAPCARALRSRLQRAHGRPHAEQLRALDPAAFDSLPERQREVLTRYYGVAGQREHTLAELSRCFGTSDTRLLRTIRRGVASMLGVVDSRQPLLVNPE